MKEDRISGSEDKVENQRQMHKINKVTKAVISGSTEQITEKVVIYINSLLQRFFHLNAQKQLLKSHGKTLAFC